jgi:hypothetical protein
MSSILTPVSDETRQIMGFDAFNLAGGQPFTAVGYVTKNARVVLGIKDDLLRIVVSFISDSGEDQFISLPMPKLRIAMNIAEMIACDVMATMGDCQWNGPYISRKIRASELFQLINAMGFVERN